MKGKLMIRLALLLLILSLAAFAQSGPPAQWAGAGISWNQYAAPQINGIAVYAHRVTSGERPLYSFSAINVQSVQMKPFRAMTSFESGVAWKAFKFGAFNIFALGTAGAATAGDAGGTEVGISFSGGGLAMAGIGRGWSLGPFVRITHPSISETQTALGVLIGWGGGQ